MDELKEPATNRPDQCDLSELEELYSNPDAFKKRKKKSTNKNIIKKSIRQNNEKMKNIFNDVLVNDIDETDMMFY